MRYIFDDERNVNDGNTHRSLYNILNVDKTRPIICTEGVIDSKMIDNSIANSGIHNFNSNIQFIIDEIGINQNNLFIIFDYDIDGIEYYIDYGKKGFNVFNWLRFMVDYNINPSDDKIDLNDIAIKFNIRFDFEMLKSYFLYNRTEEFIYMSKLNKLKKLKQKRR